MLPFLKRKEMKHIMSFLFGGILSYINLQITTELSNLKQILVSTIIALITSIITHILSQIIKTNKNDQPKF
jgi:hypothetical protein